jgi:glyoxalase family protein
MEIVGIHHVTAVTGNASLNVAFYTQVLGMRLVKKTVNQDDVSAYHLFYGDEAGHPGTELTFFDWPDLERHRPGAGTISTIMLGVTGEETLRWWQERLAAFHVEQEAIRERGPAGTLALPFRDPEGQRLELVDDGGHLHGVPWRKGPVPPEHAIHGFYAVQLTLLSLAPSARFLSQVLGFREAGSYTTAQGHPAFVFEVGPGGPGAQVHLEIQSAAPFHRYVGIGGVHHVAFRVPTDEEHRAWRERIAAVNRTVTPIIDRFYFHSIYFREPGGVLFELATDLPGFTIDEDVETLGERLSLPPFLEPRRAEITAQLRPIEPIDLLARGS